jgi:hypothetical protein
MRYKKTRLLKIEYQRVLGQKVCVRTWNKIKFRLNINDDEDLSQVSLVRAYATLKRKAPRNYFTRLDAQNYVWLSENLPKLQCNGYELRESLMRLTPKPTIQTLYRWGREISCEFSVYRSYCPSDLEKWLEKVLISRFNYITNK